MPYTKEIYEKAQEIIDERRKAAENKNAGIIRLFETIEPEYTALKQEMITSVKEVVKAIDMSPEKAAEFIQQQKIKNLTAQQNIRLLLQKHSLPEDYLEIKYSCPVCEDTGFSENKLCTCHIQLLKELAFEEAGKKSPLKFCLFEDFRFDYYPDEKISGVSARDRMRDIYSFCKEYADTFDTSNSSVFMTGKTGLGKTHLSLAIAGDVIRKGYTVLYNSAQNIFTMLQKERFGKSDTNGTYEAMVLECDLLVIDDLGAEFVTQFTNAALYNIINTRINLGLPTIISSNLTLQEIENEYSTRISSRIIGEYSILCFEGKDIRQLKSENDD